MVAMTEAQDKRTCSEPNSREPKVSAQISSGLNSLGLAKAPEQTRVVVAMSGGADSSVVAGLLKREGYDVVGVTLQLYDHGAAIHRKGACCAGQDIHDARNVAATLGIPHYVLDYEDRFRQEVIDRFAESYAHGETPIPCVECNRTVKFRDLLAMAGELDADVMATGHYVENRALPDGRFALCRPADLARDQSYFLYATTAAQLARLRFPLAGLTKAQTRAIARELGLSIAEKPDSQDICFVPSGKYADIVAKFRPEAARPGVVRHVDGRVLGQHAGVMNFTVGQRKGLGIAGREPLYVVGIDAQDSAVIVGPREALLVEVITLRDVNWLGDAPLPTREAGGLPLFVRVRSTREPKPARAWRLGEGAQVEIEGGESGVAPGQACVFYDGLGVGARVLGGGTIERKQAARPVPASHTAAVPPPSPLVAGA